MKSFCFAAMISALLTSVGAAELPPSPVDLRCDGRTAPLAASSKPLLTWRLESDQRGVSPSFYQVLVASSPDKLAESSADLWNSTRQPVARAFGVAYAGKPISAGTVCHWKVRWWDQTGKISEWSEPSYWEAAPQTPADWHGARWIDDGIANPEKDADFYKPDPAPLMRHEFELTKPISRARLHVAGLGLCLPSINGMAISDHAFDPPWTNFEKRILYRTHDLTQQLKAGKNCLGIALGNGWYNPLPLRMWSHRNIRGSLPVGRPRAIACLAIDHPDGTTTHITTGDQWTMAKGPTIRNSIYLGEVRDARLDPEGWNGPDFDDSKWEPVRLTHDSLEPLEALNLPPARKLKPLVPKAITSLAGGIHIVDFGENFTGIPELTINAPAGTEILLRYGELLHEDGTLNPMTSVCGQIKGMKNGPDGTQVPKGGPGAPEIAWQQDAYIARGGGPEVFTPRFTFHGFRYMEISGLSSVPNTSDIKAYSLHTDLATAGQFTSSNENLNRIQEMCLRTFLANVVTVQSDCPHRERFAYGGDIVATSEAYLMNFDMAGFYAKTVRDWGDATRPDGRLTDTAPFVGIDYCGVGWAMVHPLLIEQLYQYYGNRRLIEEQLPIAMKWLDVVAASRKAGLVTKGLGDHEALVGARGPEHLTPMFIDSAKRLSRLSRIIGRPADADRLETLARESTAAWTKAFYQTESGKVGNGSQPSQCFALGFSTASESNRQAIFDHLINELMAPEDSPRLTTGIYGTRILLDQLSQNGRSDLAYQLANRKTFPSWNWMLKNGATTLWEHWEGSDNTFSQNHPMFGSVSAWFYRWMGGIQCADDAVAFDKVYLRPQLIDGVEWVKSSHQSVRGEIISNWSTEGTTRTFNLTIPVGITAIAELPARPDDVLTEGGKRLSDLPELVLDRTDPTIHRIQLAAGTYSFKTEL